MKLVVILIGFLLIGCGREKNDTKNNDPFYNLTDSTPISNLNRADLGNIVISWAVKSDSKPFIVNSVKIEEDSKITAVLDSISVVNAEKGTFAALIPYGQIRFYKKDGHIIEASFLHKSQLEVSQWGQVYLQEDLYTLACEYASRAENHLIDLLTIN